MGDIIIYETIDKIRFSYKPNKVKVLLVGESVPTDGNFFYYGDSNLYNHTKSAFEKVYPEVSSLTIHDFLGFFKEKGFYLDDLCLRPVNKLDKKQRRQFIENSVPSLATRIKGYSPMVVVSILKSIEMDVSKALDSSGVGSRLYSLPFGGNGHQNKYIEELYQIVKKQKS
jgi:hypothetical protein